jgi:transcriptional regulator with XRE-family HTH domain
MAVDRTKNTRRVIIEWIEHILDRKKWTGTDLARKAGMAPSTVLRLMNDPKHTFIPTLLTLQKIADTSGYPIPPSITEALGEGEPAASSRSRTPRPRSVLELNGEEVPVRPISSLPSGMQKGSSDSESSVAKLPQLSGDETVFAVYMPDNSMAPFIKAGYLLYLSKRRDPVADDTVLVTDKEGRSRVRLLKDIDERGLSLVAANNNREETVAFDALDTVAYVVATISA